MAKAILVLLLLLCFSLLPLARQTRSHPEKQLAQDPTPIRSTWHCPCPLLQLQLLYLWQQCKTGAAPQWLKICRQPLPTCTTPLPSWHSSWLNFQMFARLPSALWQAPSGGRLLLLLTWAPGKNFQGRSVTQEPGKPGPGWATSQCAAAPADPFYLCLIFSWQRGFCISPEIPKILC